MPEYTPPTPEQISAMMKEGAGIAAQILGDQASRPTADVWLVATSAIAALLCGYTNPFERAQAVDRLAVGSLALATKLDAIRETAEGAGETRQ